jgi:hypothetical protein
MSALTKPPSDAARTDDLILRLWEARCDTAEIARRMGYGEAQIANRLAQLRDARGAPPTPTQADLAQARRARLARLQAAADRHARSRGEVPAPVMSLPPPRKPRSAPAEVVIAQIKQAVCEHQGVALADLLSHRRPAPLVRARQIAVYLARELTDLSMARLGRAFGDRDHSTILVAHRKIAQRLPADAALRAAVEAITAAVRAAAPP